MSDGTYPSESGEELSSEEDAFIKGSDESDTLSGVTDVEGGLDTVVAACVQSIRLIERQLKTLKANLRYIKCKVRDAAVVGPATRANVGVKRAACLLSDDEPDS